MVIGQRIKELRENKGLSQGDIERTSGLLRGYISRVEHGHTVPSLGTLERFAVALGVPLYRLFYDGQEPPPAPYLTPRRTLDELIEEARTDGLEPRLLVRLHGLMRRLGEHDRTFLLDFAKKLAGDFCH